MRLNDSANFTVTLRPVNDLSSFARFIWTFTDGEECGFVTGGAHFDDDAVLNAILDADGHEGVDVEGYTTELS